MCAKGRVSFAPSMDMAAAVLCVPSGNNRVESVVSVALLLGFVQWGAAMQMGSTALTKDIISFNKICPISETGMPC